MKKWEMNRRTFLRGLGTTIALPMFEAMIPSVALAATAPMRVAFIYWPNGLPLPNGGNDTNPYQAGLNILADVKNDFTLLHGLRSNAYSIHGNKAGYDADDHGASQVTLMSAQAPTVNGSQNVGMAMTVDQVIASEIFPNAKFPSLGINVQTRGLEGVAPQHAPIYSETLYWKGPNSPVKLYDRPLELFNLMFGSANPNQNNQQQDLRLQKKKQILDFVMDDIKTVRNKLGAADRQRMEEYLTSLEQVEKNIVSIPTMPANQCSTPMSPGNITYDMSTYPQRYAAMHDLMIKAFECDLTRVFDFMVGHETMSNSYVQGLQAGTTWHDYSHLGDASNSYNEENKIVAYHFNKFRELMLKMKAKQEVGGGTMLDNTLLVFHSAFGDGTSHWNGNMHFFLAGKGGGRYKPGQVIKATADVGDLWLTILQDFGVNRSSFGEGKKVIPQIKA